MEKTENKLATFIKESLRDEDIDIQQAKEQIEELVKQHNQAVVTRNALATVMNTIDDDTNWIPETKEIEVSIVW